MRNAIAISFSRGVLQPSGIRRFGNGVSQLSPLRPVLGELELELIQTQMTQKPMLRAEVYARALRASQNRKEDSV